MLAKVLKSQSPASFSSFVIPSIGGDSNEVNEGVSTFAFPATMDLVVTAEPEKLTQTYSHHENTVEDAQGEAAAIIAKAEEQSRAIEQAAMEKGLHAARQTFDAAVSARAEELRQQLSETIMEVANLRADLAAQAENDIVRLALGIARKIVGREVTIDREIVLTLARVALSRFNNRTAVTIHLHPEDLIYVNAHREKLNFHGSIELVEDRSIELGGCLVSTSTGDVDARIESQFEEIAEGLFG